MEFYVNTKGTIDRDCKPCRCAKVRANRMVRLDQYREYEMRRDMAPHRVAGRAAYAQTPQGRAAVNRAKQSYCERSPIKRAAHLMAGNAIRDGRIKREPCEVCGNAKAQAHHDDHGRPLDVRWLCTRHHAEWHRHNKPKCPPQEKAA